MNHPADCVQRWIGRPVPQSDARLRLFCLPYAGGSAALFRLWPQYLPTDIELCAVQLPGRGTRMREAPYTAVGELVTALGASIGPLLDRPYALFGHSMGALVAFELARHLGACGQAEPAHLFVSGRRAPHIAELDLPLHPLPDGAFVSAMVRRYNGIPRAILQDVELLRLFLPTLRADLTMVETHRHVEAPPLDSPITAFGGWEDERASQADLAAWRAHTHGEFDLRMFPGGHFFIQSSCAPLVEAITAALVDTEPTARPGSRHAPALSHAAMNPRVAARPAGTVTGAGAGAHNAS